MQQPSVQVQGTATGTQLQTGQQQQSGTQGGSGSGERNPMIQKRFVLGVQHDVKDGCQFIDEHTCAWTAGRSIVLYHLQDGRQRFIPASETCEAITAMAYNVTGPRRSLAIAEMSDTPAIAIYDPTTGKRKRYLQVPEVGSREYVCLAFSADGRYLVSQGGFPEWNLVLWSVDKLKAIAMIPSNDKANPSQDRRLIRQCSISPRDPTVLCVSGNGVFKLFKYQDNQLRQLPGGLGKTEPMNYLAHAWLPPDDRIIVSTDNGDLLLFENFEYRHQLPLSPSDGISIDTVLALGTKGFICGGDMGTLSIFEKSEDKELFRRVKTHTVGADRADSDSLVSSEDTVRILGFSLSPPPSDECVSVLTSSRQIYLLNLSQADYSKAEDRLCDPVCQPFHAGAITGLDICIRKPLLVTCGKDRTVILWNYLTHTAEVVKRFSSEVLCVAIHPSGLHLLVGFPDKLRFMNVYGDDIREFRSFSIRSCTECRFSHGGQFFAAMHSTIIHVYFTYTCELLGHLRGHGGKVRSIYFAPPDDTRLLSAGIDGAVYEFNLAEFNKVHDHTYKSISYHAVSGDDTTVWVAGNDRKIRQLSRLHIEQAQDEHELRNCSAGCLTQAHGLRLLLAGCDDGTVRVFNTYLAEKQVAERAQHDKAHVAAGGGGAGGGGAGVDGGGSRKEKIDIMIEAHPANSGALTRVAVTFDESIVASVGEDGVLTLWDVVAKHRGQRKENQFSEEILIDRKDLEERNRAILDLNNKVSELKLRMEHQQHKRELKHEEKMQELRERFQEGRRKQKELLEKLTGETTEQQQRFTENLKDMEERHRVEMEKIDDEYKGKIVTLNEQLSKLTDASNKEAREHEQHKQLQAQEAAQALDDMRREYAQKLRDEDDAIAALKQKQTTARKDSEETCREIEAQTELEIMDLKEKYELRMKEEVEHSAKLSAENSMNSIAEQNLRTTLGTRIQEIEHRTANQSTLHMSIHNHERDIETLRHEVAERHETINDKVKRIYDLQKKNEELGKFRFVLEYKINELNEQIAPRNEEIEAANAKYAEMELEATKYTRGNDELVLSIRGLKLKLDGQTREMENLRRQLAAAEEYQSRLHTELSELQEEENPRVVKEQAKKLFYRYAAPPSSNQPQQGGGGGRKTASAPASHQPGGAQSGNVVDDAKREYNRGRNYLERSVGGLKKKLVKDTETNRADRTRITSENVTLTKEINELRREKRALLQQRRGISNTAATAEAQRELLMQRTELTRLRSRVAELERQLHAVGKPASTAAVPTLA